ncbi:MAG: atp4 subunit B of the stator stalk of mitochondrial F1F0 ATP synthase [Cirrosporium novae-zelandiae]|nr:MAG: atp4 subunit B of the stator stalk of mitochondrial F1F0 ATP synthase [Cirrosporium novae-zelandiae]
MASRLARTAISAARVRPTALLARTLPAVSAVSIPISSVRFASNVPTEDPKKKAQSILDSLPGNSLVSKAAILSAGAGASIAAISNELYVFNEESIVAFCILTVIYGIFKYAGPMYTEWADGQIEKMKSILYAARTDHTNAVKARIESVSQMSGVVDITKQLFAVSKETAELEAKAFELEQQTALAAEAKQVLDSWVRYEGQVKNRQQKELAESVIARIHKELENPKTMQQILNQAVSDVERILATKP